MASSLHWRPFLVLASVVVGGPAAATLIDSSNVTLSESDRLFVAERVCGAKQKEAQIEAQRLETKPVTLWARVTCVSHGTLAGHPALKTAKCEKLDGKWNCESASSALRIKVRGDEVILEYSDGVTPEAAIEIVTYASNASTFNGLDVSGLVSGRCRVSDGRTAPFPGARSFNISCEAPSASITKDCWDGRCRLFFTDVNYAIP